MFFGFPQNSISIRHLRSSLTVQILFMIQRSVLTRHFMAYLSNPILLSYFVWKRNIAIDP